MTTFNKRSRTPVRGFFVAGALFLLVALGLLFRLPLSNLFWSAVAPLLQHRYGTGELEAQLASSTALAADRDVLYNENLELKARLGRPGSAPVRVLAAVLLRPPGVPYDTMVIDVGRIEGVQTGDLVSAGGNALVGEISEVYEHAARVALFSSPGEERQAFLRSTISIKIEGQGGGSMVAMVPSGTAVSVGESAVLPGIAGGLAARVSAVDKSEGAYSAVYFELPVNIFTLRFVEVWKLPPHDTE